MRFIQKMTYRKAAGLRQPFCAIKPEKANYARMSETAQANVHRRGFASRCAHRADRIGKELPYPINKKDFVSELRRAPLQAGSCSNPEEWMFLTVRST